MRQPGCVFCLENGILKGDIIARTERAYLIANDRIGVPGAYMIIPLEHIEGGLPEWWQAEVNELLQFIPWLQGDAPLDYNVSTNFGKNAGQTQLHVHTHITPRTPDQGGLGLGGLIWQHMS